VEEGEWRIEALLPFLFFQPFQLTDKRFSQGIKEEWTALAY